LNIAAVIGLRRGEVAVLSHDSAWAAAYAAEAERLRLALGTLTRDLEHVGSTAVPGLAAKPVIDLALGLASPAELAEVTRRLEQLGYTAFGERDHPGDHFFALGTEDHRTHYLHVVVFGGSRWKNYLHFRDRLRADAQLRDAYARLKIESAARHPSDRPAYQKRKERFIADVLAR
jgi:GrpB-like predicted nucleotidyltransferase (UPF0157 family)